MPRQVVTLQIGTHANFIGSHYWNLQDEYLAIPPVSRLLQPAVLFRESNPSAVRRGIVPLYAPRLQIIDATSAFGALNISTGVVLSETAYAKTKSTSLNPDPDATVWSGSAQHYVRDRITPSPYISQLSAEEEQSAELEHQQSQVQQSTYWSDFLKTRLHPRTATQITGVHHNVTPFTLFEDGQACVRSGLLEDLYDDLRFFIEECDTFGGISVLTNPDDGYAGVASSYITHIRDELGPSSPILLFGAQNYRRQYVQPSAPYHSVEFDRQFESICTRNEAQLVPFCRDIDAQYIPASSLRVAQIPHVHINSQSQFHTSAMLALALDVAQTPVRFGTSMSELISTLRPVPFASFSSLACNLPIVSTKVSYPRQGLFSLDNTTNLSNTYSRLRAIQDPIGSPEDLEQARTEVVSARGLQYHLPIVANLPTPVTLPIPFPSIFDAALDGNSTASQRAQSGESPIDLDQIALLAGMGTVPADECTKLRVFGDTLKTYSRSTDAKSIGANTEELLNAAEELLGCAEDYENL